MTILQLYVAFVRPLIGLLMGAGALWVTKVSWEREEWQERAKSNAGTKALPLS